MEDYEFHAKRIEQSRDKLLVRRDQLIVEIQTVFKDIELGDGISLREANAIDDYGTPNERARARRIDQDTHWSQVDIEQIDPACSCLCFVDPIGYRYYLPAYMIYTLKFGYGQEFDEPVIDSNIFELFIYGLDPSKSDSEGMREHKRENYGLFTSDERLCIARFLAFDAELETYDDCNNSLDAIKSEWGQYLSQAEYQHLQSIWPDHF